MKRAAVVLVASILLVSCSGSDDVDWENYDPSVRIRIDSMAAAGDCAGLQEEFDIADANNDAQLARTGDNNADLMSYIDGKMSDAGCYGENLNLADPTPSNSPMEEPRTFYFIVPDVVGLPVQKAKDALRDALYNAQAQDQSVSLQDVFDPQVVFRVSERETGRAEPGTVLQMRNLPQGSSGKIRANITIPK
jgi:hypothetical protein